MKDSTPVVDRGLGFDKTKRHVVGPKVRTVEVPRVVNYAKLYAKLGGIVQDPTIRQQVLTVLKETLDGK